MSKFVLPNPLQNVHTGSPSVNECLFHYTTGYKAGLSYEGLLELLSKFGPQSVEKISLVEKILNPACLTCMG